MAVRLLPDDVVRLVSDVADGLMWLTTTPEAADLPDGAGGSHVVKPDSSSSRAARSRCERRAGNRR